MKSTQKSLDFWVFPRWNGGHAAAATASTSTLVLVVLVVLVATMEFQGPVSCEEHVSISVFQYLCLEIW
jgi:hypothetical protein